MTELFRASASHVIKLTLSLLVVLSLAACNKDDSMENASLPSGQTATPENFPPPGVKEQNIDLWPQLKSPLQNSAELEKHIDELLGRMSLEEKVGQVLQAEIQSITPEDVKKYHIGSVLNGGGSTPNRNEQAPASDWVALADQYYEASMDTSDGGVAIPIFWGTDAVHGNGNAYGATIFPHNIGLGAANNPDLIRKIGEITAIEVRALGLEWVFAPTLAVAQNDRWGRTYESYSEDPAIVARLGKAMVEGLQGRVGTDEFLDGDHVIATAKHFLADGGTFGGDDQGDARISEEELVQIHNAGYIPALEAGALTVMASFSSWNGEKMHANKYLLTDVLKGRMGFDGLVVGDWNGHGQIPGCTNSSCPQALNAGLDLFMVTYDWKDMFHNTIKQVETGEIPLSRLEDAVRRILRVKLRAGLFDSKPSERPHAGDASLLGNADHRAVARQAVRESLVLIKNANVLPIAPDQTVLVAGNGANRISKQSGGWTVSWQGRDHANEAYPNSTSIYEGIRRAVEAGGGKAILSEDGGFQAKPDVAVVVYGEDPYAEGQGDLTTLEFEPGKKESLALLKKLKDAGIPTVSVFISGRPLWVNPELNLSDAFVAAWLPGTEGGGVADVLIAREDGSPNYDFRGKLSFSWPRTPLQDKLNPHHQNYDPLLPIGYGLTYSSTQTGPQRVDENVRGVATGTVGDIDFYVARPLEPWDVYVRKGDRRQILSGAFAALPDGDVKVETTDKDVQEDALRFTWRDVNQAALTLENGPPMDLAAHVQSGVLSFDLNVVDLARAGLSVEMRCGSGCGREVVLDEFARKMQGKGWQNIALPLSCFVHEGDTLSSVEQPFGLQVGGSGEIVIANVKFLLDGEPTFECPDYRRLSVTPETLNKFWALEWWMPRHEEKVARVKQGNVDLLFIGDSITHGWEEKGKAVWEEYYGDLNAVNLGFSGDRTENVLWRLRQGEVDGISPKAAVLMIGTNNTGHRREDARFTAAGIKAILDELRERLPRTKILLLAIFPRSGQPEDPMRQLNEEVNALIADYADGENIHFLNINDVFLDDRGVLSEDVMPDLLHPGEKGYRLWAEAMAPRLKALMN